jgi:Ras-related protein Rab-6A
MYRIQFTKPTVGIDFLVKNVSYKGKSYRLQLWDTAGQERFRSLIPNYLKDAKCALIVADVTNKESFESIDRWFQLYSDNKTAEGFSFLIGNKIDLKDQ